MGKAPNRERWSGWVAIAWILALLAIGGGIFAIATAGFIEVPRQNSFGRLQTVTEPNIFIWAIAIGQAVSATMLAAIFSMINSIYQNTCDQCANMGPSIPRADTVGDASPMVSKPEHGKGLRLTNVKSGSPVRSVLYTGCLIEKINDQPVDSVAGAESLIQKEPNKFEFQTSAGESHTKWLHVKPGPLMIEGQAADIP
ncbi:hypothetical protein [Vreelandella populi]|uniref:PDZ domain-containing protein n=1 Tax=Vreelandella populi TaxID=2498858 RepID=A0A3S0WL16_9GAMM|nr:hypothetical protein [Halomonas populi]RUR43377.1 hypothetical protein ELY37_16805 [Halomonas populi]